MSTVEYKTPNTRNVKTPKLFTKEKGKVFYSISCHSPLLPRVRSHINCDKVTDLISCLTFPIKHRRMNNGYQKLSNRKSELFFILLFNEYPGKFNRQEKSDFRYSTYSVTKIQNPVHNKCIRMF